MTDTLFIDFTKNFLIPLMTWLSVFFAFSAQGRSKRPHPMLLATIQELVNEGVFKADNLLNIGVLKQEPELHIDPIEVIKLLKG